MAKRIALLAIVVAMLIPVAARAQGGGGGDPQVEKGRAVVAQVCTTCHTTLGRMLQVHKQTREQWRDLVFFMISRGAQVMPDEIDAVTAFLVANSVRERPAARSPAPDSKTP
jgi:mono/diheme cytochrome c family protein